MSQENSTLGKETDLGLLISHICQRPQIYTGRSHFNEVAAFIQGFAYTSDTFSNELREFSKWLSGKLGFPANWYWASGIEEKFPDDEEALKQLSLLFKDFREAIQLF